VSPFTLATGTGKRGRIWRAEPSAERLPELLPEEYVKYMALMVELADVDCELLSRVLCHTGADVGELILTEKGREDLYRICVRDVKFADKKRQLTRIHFKRTKVGKSIDRYVPVPEWLAERLREHIEAHELGLGDELFRMVGSAKHYFAHTAAMVTLGLHINRKDLRHIAGIAWARAHVSPKKIMTWLGHTQLGMTMRYLAVAENDELDAPFVDLASDFLTKIDPIHEIKSAS
jgi:integrase